MKHAHTLIILLVCLLLGCASTNRGRAVQLVVASDSAADTIADTYDSWAANRIGECEGKLPPDKHTRGEFDQCTGLASSDGGKAMKKILQVVVAAQLAIKLAVECETNPLKLPQEFRDKCVDQKKADWRALRDNLLAAWEDLRPYFEAIQGDQS